MFVGRTCCRLDKGGGCEDVDDHVRLSMRQGIRGEEQRQPNVASPKVRVSKKRDSGAHQREVGGGDSRDPTPHSSMVAQTVEGGSWDVEEKETRSPHLGFKSRREKEEE
jgi:hypothetical protein